MTNTFEQLKQELSVLNPDITDEELNEMTKRLIKFFVLSAKTIYRIKHHKQIDRDSCSLSDIDNIKSQGSISSLDDKC